MKRFRWIAIGVAALVVLAIAAPDSNPLHTQYANGATYAYQRFAQWQMADPVAEGGFFRIAAAVTWTTADASSVCYDSNRPTGISGLDQRFALTYPSTKCGMYGTTGPTHHEYPVAVTGVDCWVASAVLYTVQIDSCGYIASWWNNAPDFWTVGVHFRVCSGIPKTPFWLCEGFVSMLHIGGSEVWVQDANA